ncbi:unnamed protein product [Cuscuta epithymum]|uniref:Cation/H+ exchanger domain-containing protein n=1 Tax=Cuscuta epithymum TaxID=186058 RepID=A0AAV0ETU7_9ASTE|nr:unnamed protein product [Cuscuta epithymum]
MAESGGWPPKLQVPGMTKDRCEAQILLHSPGLWGDGSDTYQYFFFTYTLPRLLLQISVIFALTHSLYLLLKRFRLPRIVSEILAGIILGPTLLGKYRITEMFILRKEGEGYVDLLSKIGYIFFIFLSGVKMDPGMISRTGSKAWTIGAVAVVVPYTAFLSFSENIIQKYPQIHRYRWPAFGSILGIQSIYAFPVIAFLLVDLKIMNSELGRLALATGLITDLLSNLISTVISNIKMGTMAAMPVLSVHAFILTLALVCLFVLTVRPLSSAIIRRTPEGKPVDTVYIIVISFMVFCSSILTDNAGLNFQYGPFILGLAVPDGPPLGSTLVEKLDTVVSGLLAPLMVTYCGTKVNLVDMYDLQFVFYVWLTLLLCYAVKYLSIFSPAVACKVPVKDAASLAFILSTQGVVQLSFYLNNIINQTYDAETFSTLTVGVMITAAASHILVASLYDYTRTYTGYQKRDIQHISPNSELRMLVCGQRLDDVVAARKLLQLSSSSRESPLSVYSLFLVELVGRATPLLIDHQLGQRNSGGASSSSRSQKMVDVLRWLEQQDVTGTTSVQFFTTISLQKFMHHDICSLAFDKLAAMIVLPFHRKWNQQGKLVQENNSLRVMNNCVLDMAPCSVAILIDRHKMMTPTPKSMTASVAVIFLGGADDREALAYGRRMSRSPAAVHLTVVRFVPWDPDAADTQWDAVLDAELLKETRLLGQHQDNVVYREERVKDGAETALTIHDMEEAFELILVGRRHRDDLPQLLGLSEWNDIPELGPIGDMLAASEITSPVSILVVQQQYTKTNK